MFSRVFPRSTEVESGRKGSKNRPQLVAALAECKKQKATLIIARLDRLSRDVRFFLEVLDDSKIELRFAEFTAADDFAGKLKDIIEGMKSRELSQRDMCEELNQLGVKTARGGTWPQTQLVRVMKRF